MTLTLVQHKSSLWIREGTMDDYVIKEQSIYNRLPIGPGDIVLDVGGHIGSFARKAVERGAEHVYSFEPEPDNYSILEKNAEGFPITPTQAAVVADLSISQELWLNGGTNTGNHSLITRRGRGSVEVPAINFGLILNKYQPSVVKIDIEGGEYAIEAYIRDLPDSVKALAIEFHYFRPDFFGRAKGMSEALSRQFTAIKEPGFGEKLWYSLGIWANTPEENYEMGMTDAEMPIEENGAEEEEISGNLIFKKFGPS